MKRSFLLLTNLFIIFFIYGQTKPELQVTPYDSLILGKKFPSQKFQWQDSIANELKRKYFSNAMPPPAGSMRKGFRYLGNNQNGFDVYQTMQDNMYILKPDSTFVSNMPVLKMPSTEKSEQDEKKN